MQKSKSLESRLSEFFGQYYIEKMTRKAHDRRRRSRKTPASHPWRQNRASKQIASHS